MRCSKLPSCGEDLTAAKAAEYFAGIQDARKKKCPVPQPKPNNSNYEECSPLESVTDFNICGEASTKGFYYYWAPSEEVQDGDSVVRTLLSRSQSGEVFGRNHVIIRASESRPSEQHYALCSVLSVNGAFGPPKDCTTVAIVTPNRVWLRGGNRHQNGCFIAAEFRQSGAIDIKFQVLTKIHPEQFSKSLLSVLQKDLSLQAQERSRDKDGKYISIESVSGLRVSQVLAGGWREALDFDLLVDAEETGQVEVYGTAHVAVCRQAVGSLTAYQGLDDAQKSMYAAKLDSLVSSAIKAPCKKTEQRDAKTIICD